MSFEAAIKAAEEVGRMDEKLMTPTHLFKHLYRMKAAVNDLLRGNEKLTCELSAIQRKINGVHEQVERGCDLVDELKQKEHFLSMAEPSLLESNRLLKSNEKDLIEEVMSLRRRAHGSTGPIEEQDCSKEGKVDLLKSPHTRVNGRSLIPRYRSRPKVVKKPGRRRKVVSSATQLQTIYEDDEPIIPLTAKPKAKSTIALSGESKKHTTALANMETKKNNTHSISGSSKMRDTTREFDDLPTIYMEEESSNTSADNKQTTKKQKPTTDFSIFIGGKKSIPRKVMFAEKPKEKKSLLPRLRKFFKTPKADRVEEIELPKMERRVVLTAPGSHTPAAPSGSKIPLLRRAPKKKKSLIPTLRKFFKTPKADRVKKIKLPKMERNQSGSKIPLFRHARILHNRVLPMPEQE